MTNQNYAGITAVLTNGIIEKNTIPEDGLAGQLLAKTDAGMEWRDISAYTADAVAEGDARPVSAAAVYEQIGNVEELLGRI